MDKSKSVREMEFAKNMILKLIENQNYSLKFVSEQIGLEEQTGLVVGKNQHVPQSFSFKSSFNKQITDSASKISTNYNFSPKTMHGGSV